MNESENSRHQIMTRAQAKQLGLKRYFTGKPCKHGHIEQRYTSNGCVKCDAISCQKYQRESKDKVYERNNKWREENRDRSREFHRNSAKKMRDWANRAAKRKKAEGKHTAKDVENIKGMQKNKCAYCKKDVSKKYHVDHVIPLSKGGSNWPKNLQILCIKCNLKKNAKHPLDWARENGLLL